MRRFVLVLVCSVFAVPVFADDGKSKATGNKEETPMSIWMEKKLDYSQAILRGLAMGNFESIKFHADKMNLLNDVEGFVRRRNPDYRTQLQTFRRVTTEIAKQAERENIEGVTLSFNLLTVSCVECHRTIRQSKSGTRDSGDKEPTKE